MHRSCVDDSTKAEGIIRAVASKRVQTFRYVIGLMALVLIGAACSSSESTGAALATPQASEQQADSDDSDDSDDSNETVVVTGEPTPTAVPEPTLADEDVASVVDLLPGQQVEDAQGNLIAIYGVAEWPEPFTALSDQAQAGFPFFGDVEAVVDPVSKLVVLDVGMCAAGIDFTGSGTAEFFVHESSTEALSTDPVLDRWVQARHPVVRPGFGFPSPAECRRGYLPVLWSGEQAPQIARYVLATRATGSADIERHVYQWELELAAIDEAQPEADQVGSRDEPFGIGQTVTFNKGRQTDSTVLVDGWAELIGVASPIEGTRLVAVSLDFCPASQSLPEFGLGVDNWNIVAPLDHDMLGAAAALDPTVNCFDGWLEFAIPFGSVPTAFFVSDGENASTGYAEWSLVDAGLAAPQP
ncbi:MAG: hypothetical protein ACI8XD_001464 [Thermoproteota archaeon]|jgi:hypothetical protein